MCIKIRTNININKELKEAVIRYYQENGGNLSLIIDEALREYLRAQKFKIQNPKEFKYRWHGDVEDMPFEVDENNPLWKKERRQL